MCSWLGRVRRYGRGLGWYVDTYLRDFALVVDELDYTDFLATTIRSTKEYSDYPMGSWAANQEKGIRNYPYSMVRLLSVLGVALF